MFIWKSGILVAGFAMAASAALVAAAGSWVPAGFAQRPLDVRFAGQWTEPASANVSARAVAKTGDENFWLSAIAQSTLAKSVEHASVLDGASHRLLAGDRIKISGKANGVQVLEVVDVKPLEVGVLTAVNGHDAPRLVLVTCKAVGNDGPGAGRLVRIILEDAPADAAVDADAIHKAL